MSRNTVPLCRPLALAALAALGACAQTREILSDPALDPVASPAPLAGPVAYTIPMPPQEPELRAPNSLWRSDARSFFKDQRAKKIGDILTVEIEIDDRAQLSNTTSRERSSSASAGVNSLFGFESQLNRILPNAVDPASLISTEGESASSGTGSLNRQEKIELTIAATISQVLENGNLVIAGRQQVRINGELRDLTISGVIRPEDVGAANTIRHSQIAEARISYGGRGSIANVQRPRPGQKIIDVISPF